MNNLRITSTAVNAINSAIHTYKIPSNVACCLVVLNIDEEWGKKTIEERLEHAKQMAFNLRKMEKTVF
jgi:hypothetical protein